LLTDAIEIVYKNQRLKDECKLNGKSILQHNFRVLGRCFTFYSTLYKADRLCLQS